MSFSCVFILDTLWKGLKLHIRSKPHAKHFDNTVVAFYIVNYKLLQLLCVCIEQKRHSVVDVRPAPWGAPLLPLHHLSALQPRSPPVHGYRFSVRLAWIWITQRMLLSFPYGMEATTVYLTSETGIHPRMLPSVSFVCSRFTQKMQKSWWARFRSARFEGLT